MFGYFKLDKTCSAHIADIHKKYYCLLCRSLGKHYGPISRLFLSYDVTLFLIMLGDNLTLEEMGRVPCVGTTAPLKHACCQTAQKKCAALNLLLVAGKLEDDVLDENSLKSKLALFLFSGLFKRARRDFPDLWDMIHSKYEELRLLEKQNGSLADIETVFSDMMTGIARHCFGLEDPDRLHLLECASKWLYFIDAVDDLDSNLLEHTFNPLQEYDSFHTLKNHHYFELASHYQELFSNLQKASGGRGTAVVNRIIFRGIPEETIRVLTRQRKIF